jgi:tetratricopeptide (TPR) repeat protein
MKKYAHILAVLTVFLAALSGVSRSVENPGITNPSITNPAGVSTVPPSSLGGGLVQSPNPLNRSSDLVVTGNVRRGMYFHSPIPYNSRTSFGSGLGSTSLDSFLRDSAGTEDFGRYSGKYGMQPYYSPTNTVTTTTPGRPGAFKPIDSRVSGLAPDVFGPDSLLDRQGPAAEDTLDSGVGPQAAPLTPQDIGRLASGETRVRPQNEPMTAEKYRKQIEQLRLELMTMRSKTPATGTEEIQKDDVIGLLPELGASDRKSPYRPGSDPLARQKPGDLTEKTESTEAPKVAEPGHVALDNESLEALLYGRNKAQTQPDITSKPDNLTPSAAELETITKQLAEMKRRVGELSTAEPSKVGTGKPGLVGTDTAGKESMTGGSNDYTRQLIAEQLRVGAPPDAAVEPDQAKGPTTGLGQVGAGAASEVEKINKLSPEELSARARQIMGPHKTLEAFNEARYRQAMVEAQDYMNQGKYYQAAGAFEKASIFDSKKPLAVAGRSLALFGAGEYMSSALYLSRAIEMSDEYARTKVDLASMLGDKDKLESRIADAKESLERSLAPELELLLAYTYYQMGRLAPAREAIASAQKAMPKSVAVQKLKAIIDAAPEPPKPK